MQSLPKKGQKKVLLVFFAVVLSTTYLALLSKRWHFYFAYLVTLFIHIPKRLPAKERGEKGASSPGAEKRECKIQGQLTFTCR